MAVRRQVCDRCRRPGALCWCQGLAQLDNQVRVCVYRHSREAGHPLNTANILALGLEHCHIEDVNERAQLAPSAAVRRGRPWLLYPGPDALPAEEVDPASIDCLIVPDGTWRKSRAMVLGSSWLQSLPRLTFSGEHKHRYKLRQCSHSENFSTVESVIYALEALEKRPGWYAPLLRALDNMMEKQARFRPDTLSDTP